MDPSRQRKTLKRAQFFNLTQAVDISSLICARKTD